MKISQTKHWRARAKIREYAAFLIDEVHLMSHHAEHSEWKKFHEVFKDAERHIKEIKKAWSLKP